jgi:7,8-dihydro-6-hydroxymethylpterin-pyrophosphokinase
VSIQAALPEAEGEGESERGERERGEREGERTLEISILYYINIIVYIIRRGGGDLGSIDTL